MRPRLFCGVRGRSSKKAQNFNSWSASFVTVAQTVPARPSATSKPTSSRLLRAPSMQSRQATHERTDGILKMTDTPTSQTYLSLDDAFTFFNERLFGNRLPTCLITLQRHRSAYGFFWCEKFGRRNHVDDGMIPTGGAAAVEPGFRKTRSCP